MAATSTAERGKGIREKTSESQPDKKQAPIWRSFASGGLGSVIGCLLCHPLVPIPLQDPSKQNIHPEFLIIMHPQSEQTNILTGLTLSKSVCKYAEREECQLSREGLKAAW
jgi:hypothetical protein